MGWLDRFKTPNEPLPTLAFRYAPTTGETLRQKRQRFSMMFADLLLWANKQHGFVALQEETKRAPLQAEFNALGDLERNKLAALIQSKYPTVAAQVRACGNGSRRSLHVDGLAGDVSLFVNGELAKGVLDYQPLGIFWESLSVDACWGGHFISNPDGPHFSIEHEGRK